MARSSDLEQGLPDPPLACSLFFPHSLSLSSGFLLKQAVPCVVAKTVPRSSQLTPHPARYLGDAHLPHPAPQNRPEDTADIYPQHIMCAAWLLLDQNRTDMLLWLRRSCWPRPLRAKASFWIHGLTKLSAVAKSICQTQPERHNSGGACTQPLQSWVWAQDIMVV